MTKKKAIPSIHVPIQESNGSIAWVWYLFFQWLAENTGNVDLSDYFTKEETEVLLELKADTADLATVAFTGDYEDLSNKPDIPAPQIQSDWTQTDTTTVDYIKNKPTLAAVATSGDYDDLINKPTIPTVGNGTITITQDGTTKGTFTTNQSEDATIDLSGGGSSTFHPDLFDWKWADHQVDDAQWLRADTFSWQYGSMYQAAYQHLVDDIGNIQKTTLYRWRRYVPSNYIYVYTLSATPQVGDAIYRKPGNDYYMSDQIVESVPDSTHISMNSDGSFPYEYNGSVEATVALRETIAGTTVLYYLADDGHKICPASEESNIAAIYAATGVAWYYILDTTNERFKLPRTQFGVTGLRDTVGKYVEAGLPNITGTFRATLNTSYNADDTGAFSRGSNLGAQVTSLKDSYTYNNYQHTLNASNASSIYGNSTTVQPKATQMYLYFYVGNFTQTAIENTAGLNAELFNGKVDVDAQNFNAVGEAYLAGLGMPSSTYIDLTLGASGASYTAPANGWVLFRSDNRPDATVRYVYFYGRGYNIRSDNTGGTAATDIMWTAPVEKGSSFSIYHNLPATGTGETRIFRFYYAEGAA